MSIEQLLNNYKDQFGEPDYVINIDSDFAIAISLPIEEEEIFDTSFVTLGLSNKLLSNHFEPNEIILELEGELDEDSCKHFAEEYSMFLIERIKTGQFFGKNQIIKHSIKLFNNTPYFFITLYDGYRSEWETEAEAISLLRFIPLHKEEALELEKVNEKTRNILINACNLNWRMRERISANIIFEGVKGIWSKIESWYSENTPSLIEELRPGTSIEKIHDLEKSLSVSLPVDLYNSLMIHDGNVYFNDYKYLTARQINIVWGALTQMKRENGFKNSPRHDNQNKIQNTWWDEKWIPFAEDSGGNCICVDLNPGKDGVVGQIIYWEIEEGPYITELVSFLDWLNDYNEKLEAGVYKVTDEGFLEE